MAIGERIHFFRNLRGMTQKFLGMAVGFPEKSADVRLAQYETGTRTPKADLTAALAKELDVSPRALNVPDIDTEVGLMHTLFALEDIYGLEPSREDGICRLWINLHTGDSSVMGDLREWLKQKEKLKAGEISKEEYDRWRYNYPKFDTSGHWHEVTPSQEVSDILVREIKKKQKKGRYHEQG